MAVAQPVKFIFIIFICFFIEITIFLFTLVIYKEKLSISPILNSNLRLKKTLNLPAVIMSFSKYDVFSYKVELKLLKTKIIKLTDFA